MRLVLLVLLSLLLSGTACDSAGPGIGWAPAGVEVQYQSLHLDGASDITPLPNGDLLVVGSTEGQRGPLDGMLTLPLVLRIEPDGILADTTVYRHVRDGTAVQAVLLEDGPAVLVEKQRQPEGDSTVTNAVLHRTSPSGERTGTLFELHDTDLARHPLVQTTDGHFLVGRSPIWDRRPDLVKLDRDGTRRWTYALSDADLVQAVEASNGDLFALGAQDDRQYTLTRLSPAGDPRWQRTYGTDTLREAERLAAVGEGVAVLGTRSVPETTKETVVLTRVGADGQVMWERTYAEGELSVSSLTTLSDGGMAFGYSVRYKEKNDWPHDTRASVLRVGPEGTVQWQRRFGPRMKDNHVSVVEARPNGNVVAAGSTGPLDTRRRADLLVVEYRAD